MFKKARPILKVEVEEVEPEKKETAKIKVWPVLNIPSQGQSDTAELTNVVHDPGSLNPSRRSERINKGVPPKRYGIFQMNVLEDLEEAWV